MDIFHDEIPCNHSEFLCIAEYRRMASMWEHMDRGFAHHLLHLPIFLFHVAPAHQVLDRPRQKNRTVQCRWRGHKQRISSIGTLNKSFRIFLDNVLPIRAKTPFIETSFIALSLSFVRLEEKLLFNVRPSNESAMMDDTLPFIIIAAFITTQTPPLGL